MPQCSFTAILRRRGFFPVSSTGPLGERFRLVAVDLPGHGASDDARDRSAYSLPGHARAVRAVVDALQLGDAVFVGWSLGGHVALEMAPELRQARGFVIFGTPPLAFPPAREAFLPHPTMRLIFSEAYRPRAGGRLCRLVLQTGFR